MIKTAKEILLEKGFVPDNEGKLFPTKNMVEFVTNWFDKHDAGEKVSLMPIYGYSVNAWEKKAMRTKKGFCLIDHDIKDEDEYTEHLLYFDTKRISHADTIGWLGALGYKIEGNVISLPTERQV